MGKLTVAKVRNAKPGIGKDGQPIKATFQDGEGLFLNCAPTGAKSWILRVQVDGKRSDIGLGAADVDGAGREAFGAGDNRLREASLMLKRSLNRNAWRHGARSSNSQFLRKVIRQLGQDFEV